MAEAGKYFLSFSNTFRSLMKGRITVADLTDANLIFGWERSTLLQEKLICPSSLTTYNRTKPDLTQGGNFCSTSGLDPEVLQVWEEFRKVIQERDAAAAVIWNKRSDNYVRRTYDLLQAGHQVFFDGDWQSIDNYKWLADDSK